MKEILERRLDKLLGEIVAYAIPLLLIFGVLGMVCFLALLSCLFPGRLGG